MKCSLMRMLLETCRIGPKLLQRVIELAPNIAKEGTLYQ